MSLPQLADPAVSAFLQTTPTFAGVPAPILQTLAPQLERLSFAAGERVIAAGDPGDSLFLVVRGRLRAVAPGPDGAETLLNEIMVGASVGEIALLTGERRTATVYAAEPSELLRLSREQLASLEAQHPAAAAAVSGAIVLRLQQSQLNLALHSSNLFAGLDAGALADLKAELELRLLRGGETLMRQGEASDALYVVISGRLRVVREQEGGESSTVYELRRGQSVGELGLIVGEPRRATVYAVRDSLVARLARRSFDRLLSAHPQAMMQQFAAPTLRLLGEQANAPRRVSSEVVTLALLPLDRAVPLADLAQALVRALAAAGPTLHLSSARLDALLTQVGAAQTAADAPASFSLVRWLSEQEAAHRFVVYEADPVASHWSERCLRQADRILLVGDARGAPRPGPLEQALLAGDDRRSAQRSLVLLHQPGVERPEGTRRWYEGRRLSAHYHVRRGSDADVARLARLATGRGVGVVLSGGGAPGFGHIGALRALAEAGVPIDLLGGTSQGGVIACQSAMGWDDATIIARNRAAIRHRFDYTFPIAALMAGAEMSAAMREMFGEAQLEDMWRPCFCISANLSRARLAVHEHGPVWKYTRATTSLPGVLPPVVDGGELLVDGGLLNNLPTDVMRRRDDCGAVIAIDASSGIGAVRNREPPYETSLSGWQVLWRRLNPFTPALKVPTMGNIMVRVAILNDAQLIKTNRSLADLYLRLPAGRHGLLEFQALEPIIEGAYRFTRERLASLADNPAFQALAGVARAM